MSTLSEIPDRRFPLPIIPSDRHHPHLSLGERWGVAPGEGTLAPGEHAPSPCPSPPRERGPLMSTLSEIPDRRVSSAHHPL